MKQDLLGDILRKLDRGDGSERDWPNHKGEYLALCPFHADAKVGNFSVSSKGKYHCFACGAEGGAVTLAQQLGIEMPRNEPGRVGVVGGLRRSQAARRGFPQRFGPPDRKYLNAPAIWIPYYGVDGQRAPVGSASRTAGISSARRRGRVWRCMACGGWRRLGPLAMCIWSKAKGDTQTLWYHDLPAIGVPGASTFRKEWAAEFAGLTVYVWCEPDKGGETFVKKIGEALPEVGSWSRRRAAKMFPSAIVPAMTCRRCWPNARAGAAVA